MSSNVIETEALRQFVGANIRRLRKKADISQVQLAKEIGISEVHLNRIEVGKSTPSAEVLFAIADFFGVATDSLRQAC